jgi:UDP-4-amino-4,6-dideoxy-N-acetyl-beta-L-altrosamine N-acetyltransferase
MEMAALDYAFGEAGLRKLSCEVLDRNRRVLRLHRRFGFYEEGLFREHVRIGDTFETVHRLAMFRTTWREMRETQALRLKQWRWHERDARRD